VSAAVRVLEAEPLDSQAFAPFGEVIDLRGARHFPINQGAVERYHDLATVETGEDGRPLISIVVASRAAAPPLTVEILERHPLGSQAFIPLQEAIMCVVVAAPGEAPRPEDLAAFVTDGRQGVNYHRGTWHMPLAAFECGQRFLVVDRGGPGGNCEEISLGTGVAVSAASLRRAGRWG